ncbi:MAG TPA: hypothetical protein VJ020_13605 [Anaerolineales bacterium]|nr:hypothetical protein [Anaerolineales bacterium]
MQLTRNPALIALSLWLVLTGLLPLFNLSFPASGTILALLAIAAGVLFLVGSVRTSRRFGPILLAVWLIATGLLPLLNIGFPASATILALLAIAAGALLVLER